MEAVHYIVCVPQPSRALTENEIWGEGEEQMEAGSEMQAAEAGTGWLLDDGKLCLGASQMNGLDLVAYTDTRAIRFARRSDADMMRIALAKAMQFSHLARTCRPREHIWIGAELEGRG